MGKSIGGYSGLGPVVAYSEISKGFTKKTKDNENFYPYESPAEKALGEALISLGIQIDPQYIDYRLIHYRADMKIIHPKLKILIEVDGHMWHRTKAQRTQDAQRSRAFQRIGWTIVRFTGKECLQNPKGCATELRNMLDILLNKHERPE